MAVQQSVQDLQMQYQAVCEKLQVLKSEKREKINTAAKYCLILFGVCMLILSVWALIDHQTVDVATVISFCVSGLISFSALCFCSIWLHLRYQRKERAMAKQFGVFPFLRPEMNISVPQYEKLTEYQRQKNRVNLRLLILAAAAGVVTLAFTLMEFDSEEKPVCVALAALAFIAVLGVATIIGNNIFRAKVRRESPDLLAPYPSLPPEQYAKWTKKRRILAGVIVGLFALFAAGIPLICIFAVNFAEKLLPFIVWLVVIPFILLFIYYNRYLSPTVYQETVAKSCDRTNRKAIMAAVFVVVCAMGAYLFLAIFRTIAQDVYRSQESAAKSIYQSVKMWQYDQDAENAPYTVDTFIWTKGDAAPDDDNSLLSRIFYYFNDAERCNFAVIADENGELSYVLVSRSEIDESELAFPDRDKQFELALTMFGRDKAIACYPDTIDET